MADVPPGMFRCEMCGRVFSLGSDAEARAEALAKGIDPDDAGLVCDDCYAKTPWGPYLTELRAEVAEIKAMVLELVNRAHAEDTARLERNRWE